MCLQAEPEERYFVFNAVAHARAGRVPQLVNEVASRIQSPFFSVDVVQTQAGGLVVMELGDGQESDRKNWSADSFAQLVGEAFV
jgi:hypothetical protein